MAGLAGALMLNLGTAAPSVAMRTELAAANAVKRQLEFAYEEEPRGSNGRGRGGRGGSGRR